MLAYNLLLRRLKVINADLDELATELIALARKSRFRLARAKSVTAMADHDAVLNRGAASGISRDVLPAGTRAA